MRTVTERLLGNLQWATHILGSCKKAHFRDKNPKFCGLLCHSNYNKIQYAMKNQRRKSPTQNNMENTHENVDFL